MNLSGAWQGYIAGTNRGILWLDFKQNNLKLSGSGTLTDFDLGVTLFDFEGDIVNETVSIKATNLRGAQTQLPTQVNVSCEILNHGSGLFGTWSSDKGTQGRLVLSRPAAVTPGLPSALFSRPITLKAYRLDALSFTGLLEICLRGMNSVPVFRIIEGGVTHIKSGLPELVESWRTWPDETINEISISVTDNLPGLSAKEILLEFKRNDPNRLTVTSADSVWVDGKIEQIRKYLDRHQARLNLMYRKYGTYLNSIIFLGMLVWLPSLSSVISRLYFVLGTFVVLFSLLYFYNRLLPNTEIFVREKKPTFLRRNRDALIVSLITAMAGGLITLLGKLITIMFSGK